MACGLPSGSTKGEVSVNKFAKLLLLSVCLVFAVVAPVLAADAPGAGKGGGMTLLDGTKFIGVGLVVIGAAYGIGRLASSAYDGMARQPEVAGSIQTAMIIAAALIEGFTFFALYICWSTT
jgi:F-type H+-transporting ATPase subunit c